MTFTVTDIQMFNLLKQKFGEKDAENFVGFLHSNVKQELEQQTLHLATKEDLAQLEIRMARMETRMTLWAFVFWATQLAAMFAFLKFFIDK